VKTAILVQPESRAQPVSKVHGALLVPLALRVSKEKQVPVDRLELAANLALRVHAEIPATRGRREK